MKWLIYTFVGISILWFKCFWGLNLGLKEIMSLWKSAPVPTDWPVIKLAFQSAILRWQLFGLKKVRRSQCEASRLWIRIKSQRQVKFKRLFKMSSASFSEKSTPYYFSFEYTKEAILPPGAFYILPLPKSAAGIETPQNNLFNTK